MRHRRRAIRFAALSALGCALFSSICLPALAQDEIVALQGARILTVTDGIIDNGVLVISGGRITALGPHVPIPSGARVIDVTGKTVMPGLIDGFTNLNPDNRFIPLARSAGVTAALCAPADGNLVTGQSALVRLAGSRMEEMVVRFPVGLHISLGEAAKVRYGERNQMPGTRMGSAALLRQTLMDARGYADKLALHERKLAEYRAGKGEEKAKEPTPPARNLQQEALLPVLRGETPVIVSADRFDDIHTALRIAEEFDLRIIVNHGAEAHRVAGELAERDIPVIWGPAGARYRKLESQEGTPETPALLARAGIRFAFQTGSAENPVGLLEQARSAMAHGLPYQAALEALTISPARIFGVADQLGSLEVGKSADLVVFNGDPLREIARVERVFIGGKEF